MPSLYNADLKPIGGGDSTHSYDHATKLFIADNFRLAPKQSFLYYVCINLNQNALSSLTTLFPSDGVSSQSLIEQFETGMLAKRVDLPKFSIDTKTLNAYNRKNIIQNKISYDPVSITFHDDAADVVTNFWNDYYTYYYRDSDYSEELYLSTHKYTPRQREGWGFTPRFKNLIPFLRSIQIFSLHNKRFTEYVLINPTITAWRHGEHSYSDGTGTLENTMTVAYETVKYKTGYINVTEMPGFGTIHYDNYPSPISTSTTNIYSDAGIIGAVAGASKDLSRPDGTGSGRNITSGVLDAYRLYTNLKNVNFQNIFNTTVGQVGVGIINGAINSSVNGVFFPTLNGSPGYGGVNGSSQVYTGGATEASQYANPFNSAAITIGSTAVGAVTGPVTDIIQTGAVQATNAARGIIGSFNLPNPFNTAAVQVKSTNGTVATDPVTGQPVTNQNIVNVYNDTGGVIAQISSIGDQTGTYNSADLNLNLQSIQIQTDSNNQNIRVNTYRDGTVVILDYETDNVISVTPGAPLVGGQGYKINNTNPVSTRDQIIAGQPFNPAKTQIYTDPTTGVIYSVGNTTTARINNAITGTAGALSGLYAGQFVNKTLNSALGSIGLGKTVIGQTFSAAIAGAAGASIGKIVNNTLQPIVNTATGKVEQVFDKVSGEFRNVIGSITGTGGRDPANPTKNAVDYTDYGDGTILATYQNGSQWVLDTDGKWTQTKAPDPSITERISNTWSSITGKNLPGQVSTDSQDRVSGTQAYGETDPAPAPNNEEIRYYDKNETTNYTNDQSNDGIDYA